MTTSTEPTPPQSAATGDSTPVSVERLQPDQLPALGIFFQQAYVDQPVAPSFQGQDILSRWRYLHQDNPVVLDRKLPAWLCVRDGQILGHFSMLASEAVVHGRVIPVCWGINLIVDGRTRGQGVGRLLTNALIRGAQRPVLFAGLNAASHGLFLSCGVTDLGTIPLFIKVFHPDRLLEQVSWPTPLRWIAARGLGTMQRLRRPRRRQSTRLTIEPWEAFDGRFDAWWRDVEPAFPCVMRRTSDTMTWRYRRHPQHAYSIFVARDAGRMRGLVILRRGHSKGVPTGFITELLTHPEDADAIQNLLSHSVDFLRAAGDESPVMIRCAVRHTLFQRALARAGFLRVPSHLHWMVGHAKGQTAIEAMTRQNEWLINGGDCDLDVT